MNITQLLPRYELSIQAGKNNIYAGVKEHFKDVEGGHECKLCGHVAPHVRGAQIHIAVHHKDKLEHAGNVTVKAGGPGSGRHKLGLSDKATGNKVSTALEKIGFERDNSKSNLGDGMNYIRRSDGVEAMHLNPSYKSNNLVLNYINHDDAGDIAEHLDKHGLLGSKNI